MMLVCMSLVLVLSVLVIDVCMCVFPWGCSGGGGRNMDDVIVSVVDGVVAGDGRVDVVVLYGVVLVIIAIGRARRSGDVCGWCCVSLFWCGWYRVCPWW